MTFPIVGSECVPGTLDIRPAAEPGDVRTTAAAIDLVSLFVLDCPPRGRRLVCRWRRQADGRLACSWEPDIVVIPQR
jgi:hypothetical protein